MTGHRIAIGFRGGSTLSLRITGDALRGLLAALPAGGWHELPAEGGTVTVALGEIAYLHAEETAGRVGF